VPGPLFTFSAYLGAIGEPSSNGVAGAGIALAGIFLPSFLLLGGVLPLWSAVRERDIVQAAVAGVGAAVVGLLAAAFWDPIVRTSVDGAGDALLVAALFALLRVAPAWAVVARQRSSARWCCSPTAGAHCRRARRRRSHDVRAVAPARSSSGAEMPILSNAANVTCPGKVGGISSAAPRCLDEPERQRRPSRSPSRSRPPRRAARSPGRCCRPRADGRARRLARGGARPCDDPRRVPIGEASSGRVP
jgi:hypothetical protein